MRILIVIDDFFNKSNGMCISTQRFAHEFKKAGNEVRIVSYNFGGQADYPLPEMIIPFFRKIIAKEGYHMALPKNKVLKKAIDWADIVAVETPFPVSWRTAKLAKKMNKPTYGTFHIYPGNITETLHINNRFFNDFFMYFFREVSFRNCLALQCPTDKVKKQLEKYHFKQRLYVISNGITEDFIQNPHKEKIGHPFTILCIGRFSREKHQEVLFKAMKLAKHNQEIKLIFAGKGPLKNEYQKLAKELPKRPIMKFYTSEQLRKVMSKADLVVHCADVEIEGMACMEAFAAGCVPVIANSELSSTADYGLTKHNLFPAGDSEKLADRIDYWFEHPDKLKKMRKTYREYAKTLTVHTSAQKALKMMNDIRYK
ncbi:glycosyltransferase [Lactobacillus hamsteri]|uniref:Type 1 capsular polysaccharide biosynthesis protein n=1 Tax=Lactobacillus hamsteri DSM 5661 = JCM 6256 TaxID=1423754 RepID=A0A0R1YIH3_9LACO|nr:glycosyltransferase [Lactobacillus hamsteri]KRM40708.1 type 1 capsular polysaccharide biosynthesis protein [Lactobacillus hamsteri DSM 5661 = JCM 6256]